MQNDPSGPEAPTLPQDSELYRLLVESITDYAVYVLDASGHVVSWNPGAQRFKGYAANEIVGRHFSTFYTPEDRDAGAPERALRTAADKGRFEAEGWRVRNDGSRFWAHVVIDPIHSPTGEVVGYAKITRDLTERRTAAEALRDSEEQLRLLVNGVTDYAIYMLTPEGHVRTWNAGAQRIKGYAPDEVIGQHFSLFYAPEDQDAGRPAYGLATAEAEGRFESEGWRVRKDGTRFWASTVIDAVRADNGRLLGFAKVTRDFTDRRMAAEDLEKAREALFHSQKLEALGQLTGGVAHDFNNLLMAVIGSLELAKKQAPDNPRLARLLDNAMQGAQRGAALTRRMLAFARQQELKSEDVDVAALIQGMLDLIARSVGGSVSVHTHLAPNLPRVTTDRNQLEMALLNLAVNSRDAMPQGGVITISATIEQVASDVDEKLVEGPYVRLCVTDTGAGMAPETVSRATDPFFTTKEVGKGTGLGLSMVRGLVEQSGGKLRINSTLGKGTDIELLFPVAAEAADHEVIPDRPNPPSLAAPLSVLVVDDDPLVLLNCAFMLEDLGHTVTQATGAAGALDVLEAGGSFDVVITDQVMPKTTGLQLADEIIRRFPNLPIILASGYADEADVPAHITRLAKPFMQVDLARVLSAATSAVAE